MGAALAVSLLLMACDGGKTGGSGPSMMQAKISGAVNNQKGPVVHGRIKVTDPQGSIVATAILHGQARYTVTVPAGVSYPVVIAAFPEGSGAAAEVVKAVVTEPFSEKVDLAPLSTRVVESALARGGLTQENIAAASMAALSQRRLSGGGGEAGEHAGH